MKIEHSYAQESAAIAALRQELSAGTSSLGSASQRGESAVIKNPQSQAVLDIMQRLLQSGG